MEGQEVLIRGFGMLK